MFQAHYWSQEKARYLLERYERMILGATAIYVPLLFLVQNFMRNRQPFQLKYLYFFWNASLSFFSGMGVFIFLFFDPACLLKTSLSESECHPCIRACVYTFCLTKAIEFGDSFLLAFKKKPLRFLHVYHHLTVTLYCWHAIKVSASFGHLFAFINLTIHCFMYLYFAIATVYPRHPLLLASSSYITICQTTQMFVGMYLSFSVLFRDFNRSMVPPTLEHANAMFALFLYTSYAYLFVLFYVERYIKTARLSMVLALTTLHFGGLIGAVFAWNHPRRYRIFLEIAIGYSLTASFAYICCNSFPRMTRCRNFLRLLLESETPHATELVKKLPDNATYKNDISRMSHSVSHPFLFKIKVPLFSKQNRGFSTSQNAFACDHNCGQKISTKGSLLPSKSIHLDAKLTSQQEERSYNEIADRRLLLVQHELAFPMPTKTNHCRVKQVLAFFNAWVLAALEKYQESFQTPSGVKSSPFKQASVEEKPKDLNKSFILLKYLSLSWLSLNDLETFPMLGNQFFFFLASLVIPAIYGFLAHGNILLGLLVHGCLRWIIELYTTGVLVTS